ncbi:MAG TPA: redoxin domain-containing protein [Ktedonobacterales bacterium]|nr:redoxin domain-containing protein [Ktedonobacterales bacterium]
MRLTTGAAAPMFATTDAFERSVALSMFAGERTLLSFYRSAVCPLCNLRFLYLLDQYAFYRAQGLAIVAVFESPALVVRQYLDQRRPPFPVIADPTDSLYALYNVERSWLGTLRARLTRGSMYREAARRKAGGTTVKQVFGVGRAVNRMPADFLIGPDLRIATAYYGRDAGDFLPFSRIHEFIGAYPPGARAR